MFTAAQLKGKIKYFAKQKNPDARILLRIYMMERFLERITNSNYVDKIVREKYLKNLWVLYQKKYEYAQPVDYETVMYSILVLFKIVEL